MPFGGTGGTTGRSEDDSHQHRQQRMNAANWLFAAVATVAGLAVTIGVFLWAAARQAAGLLVYLPRKAGRGK